MKESWALQHEEYANRRVW